MFNAESINKIGEGGAMGAVYGIDYLVLGDMEAVGQQEH